MSNFAMQKGQTLCSAIKCISFRHCFCFVLFFNAFSNVFLATSINLVSIRLFKNARGSECTGITLWIFIPFPLIQPFFFFLAEALEGPPLGVYRLRLQKDAAETREDGGHPAKSQVCGALQSQKAAAECGANEGAHFSTPRLHNGPRSPTITHHSHSATARSGGGGGVGWAGVGWCGWQGGLAEGDAGIPSKPERDPK